MKKNKAPITFHRLHILKVNPKLVDRTVEGSYRWGPYCANDSRAFGADLKWEMECVEEKEFKLPPGWIAYGGIVERPNGRAHYIESLIDVDTGEFIDRADLARVPC